MDSQSSKIALTEEAIAEKWAEFKQKFGKNYSGDEEISRKQNFVKTLQTVEEHNEKHKQGLVTFTMGINQFADMTDEEKKCYTHGVRRK